MDKMELVLQAFHLFLEQEQKLFSKHEYDLDQDVKKIQKAKEQRQNGS